MEPASDMSSAGWRFSTSDWIATWLLPAVFSVFSERHPLVAVELATGFRLSSLSHREADLAFRVVPFEEADVIQRRLATLAFGVYSAEGADVGAADGGAGLRIIEDIQAEAAPANGWLRRRLPRAAVTLRSNSRTSQAGMCARGVGLAVLPWAIGDGSPALRRVDLGDEPPSCTLWIGYHRDLRTARRLRAFVEVAVEQLSAASRPGGTPDSAA